MSLGGDKVTEAPVFPGEDALGMHLANQKKDAGTYVLFPHYVVEGQLRAPRPFGEGRPAVPPVRAAHGLLDDVFGQGQQTLLGLLN